MTIKERRKALGLSRAQLSAYAYVDPRICQLIEMNSSHDKDCIHRLEATLLCLENGQEPPAWKQSVDEQIAAEGAQRLVADPDKDIQ